MEITNLSGFRHHYYKTLANKYFPEFYGKDFNLLRYQTKGDLLAKLQENLKDLTDSFSRYDYNDIKKAYEYIIASLDEYSIELKRPETKKLWMNYNSLITEISNYHFYPKLRATSGYKQNKINEELLFNISIFHIIILGILKDIDNFLNKEKFDYANIACLLNDFSNLLSDRTNELIKIRTERERIMDNMYNEEGYYSTLGKVNKKWRLARNKAYYSIYLFYKKLTQSKKIKEITSDNQNKENKNNYHYSSSKIDSLNDILYLIETKNYFYSMIQSANKPVYEINTDSNLHI